MKNSENTSETPTWVPFMLDETRKPLSQLGTEKNNLLFRKKSQSAKNPNEFSMLAKRFVPSKSRGSFDENKLEKIRIVPNNRVLKETSWFRYSKLVRQENQFLR